MNIYLLCALGFFIQFFPCAVMIFMPFPKEAYRFSPRKIFIWITCISVLFSAVFSIVLCLRDMSRYPAHTVISNLFILSAMLLILAAYIWLVRESLIKKTLVFFIVLFYAVTAFVIVNMLQPFFIKGTTTIAYPYAGITVLLYAATTAVLLPLMLVCVLRPLKTYILEIEQQSMKREFFITILSTLLYFVMTIYGITAIYGNRGGVGKWGALQLQSLLILLMMLNEILIYWLIFREAVRRKRDSEKRRAMEIRQMQYEKISGDMENVRRMRHDLRHHYASLNDMLDRGKIEEMKDYLSKIIDTTVRREAETYCKDITVNALMQYYIGLARDEGISCETHIECNELAIEATDMTVLFGNAMENAINACKKYPGKRWINIQIGMVQGSFAIEISNSCKSVRLNRRFQTEDGFLPAEAFQSSRPGGGYGLRSIAHTAQKYDGSASFHFNAGKEIFTARIRLNAGTDVI